MAAKRRRTGTRRITAGPRGPRGKRGKTGPPGPRGRANGDIVKLSAQMNVIVQALQTQLTRIAQLQAQLDRLAGGEAPQAERRAIRRTDH